MAPAFDRRGPERPPIPACDHCQSSAHVSVTVRTAMALYLRCAHCGYVWSITKPAESSWSPIRAAVASRAESNE